MKNILLVEDEYEIVKLLKLHFKPSEFCVDSCGKGSIALEKIQQERYDLVVLDIKLPDINGIELCRNIRANNDMPVMMLTSITEVADKVLALETGADDYITKPFSVLELIARTKALLRRAEQNKAVTEGETEIGIKALFINKNKRLATLNEKRLDLTVKEFDLLFLLAEYAGKTFSRKEILEKVWGYSFAGYEHTVTSHINRLRIKIEEDLADPKYILTSWGTGYRFSDEK
ncbi:MAG: response regulator transcription factor [Parafilimonas sp.]